MSFPDDKHLDDKHPDDQSRNVPLQSSFDQTDLETLRSELLQSGLDIWQAGELVSSFLAARGFGVSAGDARSVASRIESVSCNIDCMRHELNKLAFFM